MGGGEGWKHYPVDQLFEEALMIEFSFMTERSKTSLLDSTIIQWSNPERFVEEAVAASGVAGS